MTEEINLSDEVQKGYRVIDGIRSIAKTSRLASSHNNLDGNSLAVEDFEEIFRTIENLASEAETVISNLEAVKGTKGKI